MNYTPQLIWVKTESEKKCSQGGNNHSQDLIRRIFTREAYTGKPHIPITYDKLKGKKQGNPISYPQIIDSEIFNKAQEKKKLKNQNCLRKESYYFAKNLLRCDECGYSYVGYKFARTYQCGI
ncbi:MAG: recombinase family protein [Muribaculaceae bacterium]|nr:recombinase family protein [Muribaculaceae bacterium]